MRTIQESSLLLEEMLEKWDAVRKSCWKTRIVPEFLPFVHLPLLTFKNKKFTFATSETSFCFQFPISFGFKGAFESMGIIQIILLRL
ncbi:MAG: hypothetical protein ACI4UT_01735, partial [Candidatus Enteromonas sp.]